MQSGDPTFLNHVMDRSAMRQMIAELVFQCGNSRTVCALEELKALGFDHATRTGVSLGIDDLVASSSRDSLVHDAEYQSQTSEEAYRRGSIDASEKLHEVVELWHTTSEFLKREMSLHFQMVEPLNPVHMMSFSGARASISQVHQLVGMRGFMTDPQGRVIDFPIQTNLREGMSIIEYVISCYGARKGVVDTAIRTADAGYLTRRLVEVAQHVAIASADCGTSCGVRLHSIQNEQGGHYAFYQDRLIGRVLARAIYVHGRCIAARNQDIGGTLADGLVALAQASVLVRSPLTCRESGWVCQLCYGWSSNYGSLVDIGEAIGIVAGQSIGEPGTQLILRTFHTGGVFTGDITNYMRATSNGTVSFESTMCTPTRNRYGRPAWRSLQELTLTIETSESTHRMTIPCDSLLVVANNQYIYSDQVVAEIRMIYPPLRERVQRETYSAVQGQMLYRHSTRPVNRLNNTSVDLDPDDLKTDRTILVWILSAYLSEPSKEPAWSVFHIQDHAQGGLALAVQRSLPSEHRRLEKRSVFTKRSTMLSGKSRLMWNNVLQQMTANVFSRIHSCALPSGTIYSTACGSSRDAQIHRFVVLASPDQGKAPFHHLHRVVNRPGVLKQIQQKLSKETLIPSALQILQWMDLYQLNPTLSNSTKQPSKLCALTAELITLRARKPEMLSLGAIGCLSRRVCHAAHSCMNGQMCTLGLEHINQHTLFKRWHRNSENGLYYAIGDWIVNHLAFTMSQLAWSLKQACQSLNLGQLLTNPTAVQDCDHSIEAGKVISLSERDTVLRLAHCHLMVKRTRVYGYCYDTLSDQEPLVTLLYEQLRATDIVQGLPKAEKLFEARLQNQAIRQLQHHVDTSMNSFSHWPKTHILSTEKSFEATQINIVDKVQAVYLSQGVRIFDKHVEVIVRQMSKVIFLESEYPLSCHSVALLPGELLELTRARKMSLVLQEPNQYQPALSGITRVSMSANSFLAAASFERTTYVLSLAALQGRLDWIHGLQENVIFGGFIPVGTGCEQILHPGITSRITRVLDRRSAGLKCNKDLLAYVQSDEHIAIFTQHLFAGVPVQEQTQCIGLDTTCSDEWTNFNLDSTIAKHRVYSKLTYAASLSIIRRKSEMAAQTKVLVKSVSHTRSSSSEKSRLSSL